MSLSVSRPQFQKRGEEQFIRGIYNFLQKERARPRVSFGQMIYVAIFFCLTVPARDLDQVRNDKIIVATMRPPGSRFAVLERRVIIAGPPAAVKLSKSGDRRVLDALIPLLRDRDRAWAANAILARMTGVGEKLVDTWQGRPSDWWEALGKSSYSGWSRWLAEHRSQLRWDATEERFR
jgi:hypothetical protein